MRQVLQIIYLILIATAVCNAQDLNSLLLKNYKPRSIYKIPVTKISKAKFPVIDMHSHAYPRNQQELDRWIQTMDQVGVEKTIILSMAAGKQFDSVYAVYSKYGNRFEVWCGFDYTGYKEPGWSEKAVNELERCVMVGAKGVGELGDKGLGELFSDPVPAYGMHLNDPRMKPLFKRCGELKLPVNVHVAEPYWMYLPIDSTNDGLMNAAEWRIDTTKENLLRHAQLIGTLEHIVKDNPATTFIACHYANCEYDLSILGNLLDKYANLYADIAARYGETASIPRYMKVFFERYQNRLLYGTDLGCTPLMYEETFRILETNDEHFYPVEVNSYHWPVHGFGLSDPVLKKVYRSNALRILKR